MNGYRARPVNKLNWDYKPLDASLSRDDPPELDPIKGFLDKDGPVRLRLLLVQRSQFYQFATPGR